MHFKINTYSFKLLTLLLACIGFNTIAFAQKKPDSSKTSITILGSDYSEYIQSEGKTVQKLINNVKLLHGSDTLYCDSAFFYQTQNGFEAFGDVAIFQADGTEAFADYMRYTGSNKTVYMKANESDVKLSDGKGNNLWSKELYYNLSTKIGNYTKGGTLQSDATILSSTTGVYNLRTKDAVFQKNVDVNDPEYHVTSTHLGYNTTTKIVRFLGPSLVTNDKSILRTSSGTYDTKDKSGHFVNRSSILNEAQYVEADTLDYDRNTGFAIATGNVIALDTTQNSSLYCGIAKYNEISKVLVAYEKPIMKTINEKDSLFIKGDTFFSKPIVDSDSLTAQDSLQMTADILRGSVGMDSIPGTDSIVVTDSITGTDSIIGTDGMVRDIDSVLLPNDSLSLINEKQELLDSVKIQSADSVTTVLTNATEQTPDTQDSLVLPLQNITEKDSLPDLKERMDILVYDKKNNGDKTPKDSTVNSYSLSEQQKMDSTAYSYTNRPAEKDTASPPRYFTVYHNVWIYSDSLQGRCDSLSYSQKDSLMRMFVNPVLWQEKSQITGDIILLQMDSSKLKELTVPSNAIMISRSGPPKAEMFDQVQGNVIKGYFKNNKLDSMTAKPNASSIYFATDESDAYIGASEASSESMEIIFDDGKIKTIYYRKNVEQTMTPMKDVVPDSLRLERFKWREEERPKSLEEFLDGVVLPKTPELSEGL